LHIQPELVLDSRPISSGEVRLASMPAGIVSNRQ
jgi:hypothetical protein